MKLINKSALVAEIEKRRKNWWYGSSIEAKYKREECDDILSFINNLEVKEMDLEKEINRLWKKYSYLNMDWLRPVASLQFPEFSDIAKHFFELGIKA